MIYVGLDDFCDEHADEFEEHLKRIRDVYPLFKVTLYTIPQKTTTRLLEEWTYKYPCLQFAVHGLTHEEGENWFHEYDLCMQIINQYFGEGWNGYPEKLPLMTRGFKAPWWKLGHIAARAFNEMGYWVAVNGTHTVDAHELSMAFDYKTGHRENAADLHYTNVKSGDQYWHGHVQSQRRYNAVNPNGIGDVLQKFVTTFDHGAAFGYVNSLFTPF